MNAARKPAGQSVAAGSEASATVEFTWAELGTLCDILGESKTPDRIAGFMHEPEVATAYGKIRKVLGR
jgi:hypothetical protein